MARASFYGGMIAEGFIGLAHGATVGMTFYPCLAPRRHADRGGFSRLLPTAAPANVVTQSSMALMGTFWRRPPAISGRRRHLCQSLSGGHGLPAPPVTTQLREAISYDQKSK